MEWVSSNRNGRLRIESQELTGRFNKATGEQSRQGRNNLIVYENYAMGQRRVTVAENVVVSEDSRYVYYQPSGRTVEHTERISRTQSRPRTSERDVRVGI